MEGAQPLPEVAVVWVDVLPRPWAGVARRLQLTAGAQCGSRRATALRERPAVNPRTWRPACSRRVIASARGGGTYAEHCALTWNAPDPHGPPAATLPPGA